MLGLQGYREGEQRRRLLEVRVHAYPRDASQLLQGLRVALQRRGLGDTPLGAKRKTIQDQTPRAAKSRRDLDVLMLHIKTYNLDLVSPKTDLGAA